MFGYLHPRLKNAPRELRTQYRSLYCGLCHSLKKNYGYTGVACLNYEVVFILMLIMSVEEEEKTIFHGSCCITPLVRVPFVDYLAADVSAVSAIAMLCSSYEIKDNVGDSGALRWRVADWIISKRAAKARGELSSFEKNIEAKVMRFYSCEQDPRVLLPEITKACGDVIESAVEPLLMYVDGPLAASISRIANEIGQWIYIVDACDDYAKDKESGNYNPLHSLNDGKLVRDMISALQASVSELVHALPMRQFKELVTYCVDQCLPYNSGRVLEKCERWINCEREV